MIPVQEPLNKNSKSWSEKQPGPKLSIQKKKYHLSLKDVGVATYFPCLKAEKHKKKTTTLELCFWPILEDAEITTHDSGKEN